MHYFTHILKVKSGFWPFFNFFWRCWQGMEIDQENEGGFKTY